jgi:hypothetical protein
MPQPVTLSAFVASFKISFELKIPTRLKTIIVSMSGMRVAEVALLRHVATRGCYEASESQFRLLFMSAVSGFFRGFSFDREFRSRIESYTSGQGGTLRPTCL